MWWVSWLFVGKGNFLGKNTRTKKRKSLQRKGHWMYVMRTILNFRNRMMIRHSLANSQTTKQKNKNWWTIYLTQIGNRHSTFTFLFCVSFLHYFWLLPNGSRKRLCFVTWQYTLLLPFHKSCKSHFTSFWVFSPSFWRSKIKYQSNQSNGNWLINSMH